MSLKYNKQKIEIIEIRYESESNEIPVILLKNDLDKIEILQKAYEEISGEKIDVLIKTESGSFREIIKIIKYNSTSLLSNDLSIIKLAKLAKKYFYIKKKIESTEYDPDFIMKIREEGFEWILKIILQNGKYWNNLKLYNAIRKSGSNKKDAIVDDEKINIYNEKTNFSLVEKNLKKWKNYIENENEIQEYKNERLNVVGGSFLDVHTDLNKQIIKVYHPQNPMIKYNAKYKHEIKISELKKKDSYIICDYKLVHRKNKKSKMEIEKIHEFFLSERLYEENKYYFE